MTRKNGPGRALPTGGPPPAGAREDGLRRLRRMSNWTLAGLIAGVGVTTALLERAASQTATTPAVTGTTPIAGTAATGKAPHLSTPAATTTASGVVIPAGGGGTAARASSTVNGRSVVAGGDS